MLDNLFTFSPAEICVTGITIGLFIILQCYYLTTYARPLRVAKKREQTGLPQDADHQPPVSIILYAKNDSTNLREHLPSLLSQDYPEYEVIVVNDGSSDDTDEALKILESQYKHLYHTYLSADIRYVSRRKLALTLGIQHRQRMGQDDQRFAVRVEGLFVFAHPSLQGAEVGVGVPRLFSGRF